MAVSPAVLWQNVSLRGAGAIAGFLAIASVTEGLGEMVFPTILFVGVVVKGVVDETDTLPEGAGSVLAGFAFLLGGVSLLVDNPTLAWLPVVVALWLLFDGIRTVRETERSRTSV